MSGLGDTAYVNCCVMPFERSDARGGVSSLSLGITIHLPMSGLEDTAYINCGVILLEHSDARGGVELFCLGMFTGSRFVFR